MAKEFPTAAVISITTGRLMCAFSELHECCEFLVGSPIFTHQFAHKPFVDEITNGLYAQHPQLKDVDVTDCDKGNWQAIRDREVSKLGAALMLTPSRQNMC